MSQVRLRQSTQWSVLSYVTFGFHSNTKFQEEIQDFLSLRHTSICSLWPLERPCQPRWKIFTQIMYVYLNTDLLYYRYYQVNSQQYYFQDTLLFLETLLLFYAPLSFLSLYLSLSPLLKQSYLLFHFSYLITVPSYVPLYQTPNPPNRAIVPFTSLVPSVTPEYVLTEALELGVLYERARIMFFLLMGYIT